MQHVGDEGGGNKKVFAVTRFKAISRASSSCFGEQRDQAGVRRKYSVGQHDVTKLLAVIVSNKRHSRSEIGRSAVFIKA